MARHAARLSGDRTVRLTYERRSFSVLPRIGRDSCGMRISPYIVRIKEKHNEYVR
jgi:hypothetical protein